MPSAQQQTIRDALRADSQPLILVRMRRILYISIIGLVLSAASDLRLRPAVPYDLIALKLAGALAQGIAIILIALVRRASWIASMTVAVASWSLACIVTSVNASYTADPIMPTLLLPVMIIAAGVVFPWGARPQLAVAAVASVAFVPHAFALGTNLVVSVYSAFAASVYVAAAFRRQQIERKAIELLQADHQGVLEQIAADAPLDRIFSEVLSTLLCQMPGAMCALLVLDSESNRLRCAASIGLPQEYCGALEALGLDANAESAAAIRSGTRELTADFKTDRRWTDGNAVAVAHGLRSGWSEPIRASDRRVLGVIAVYDRAPSRPDARELTLVEGVARLLGIAIDRCAARAQLERYVSALDDARQQAEQQAGQLQEQAVQLAEARDQALASVRARSQFLANMSHEIRTPLNGIIGTTEILLDTELSSAQREYGRILSQCGEHLLSVINDILDLSKIEAGKIDIEHVELDLRALMEDVAGVLATRAQDKGIELVTSIPSDLDPCLKGDPSRLRQVLVNLVGNAIKFTEKGEVVIEVVMLQGSPTSLPVRLVVRDTGIGIAPDRQAAVFESFTQADGSTTRNYGGTGLGLTICRELVHLMGGRIELESTLGQGSAFFVDLPLERVPAAAATRRAASAHLAGLRVLVVDDTAVNRLILRQCLQGWGCRVQEAASGIEGLMLLQEGLQRDPFGLVILDMQMPELDGFATARLVKANAPLAGVPLILLSSIGGLGGGYREAHEIGFAAVITKPVRQSALLDAVLCTLGETGIAPERAAHATLAPARPAVALRVLLAEDNRVNQLVAQRLLEKLGCETDTVDNGLAAFDAVFRTRYDVVLMDIQMPVMDGFEATVLIRGRETGGEHVPIIAMTAHAMQGDCERCLAAGMDGYVAKPVSIAALGRILAALEPRNPVGMTVGTETEILAVAAAVST